MSTKIYNGLTVSKPITQVYNDLLSIIPRVDQNVKDNIKLHIGIALVGKLDKLATINKNDSVISNDDLDDMLRDVKNKFDDEVVNELFPEAWIQLFPYNENRTFAYASESSLNSTTGCPQLLADIGFREYMYYNNTDQPDDITDAQWEKRKFIWDEILNRGNGFSFERSALTMTLRPKPNRWLIIDHKSPVINFLENVRDLKSHSDETRRELVCSDLSRRIITEIQQEVELGLDDSAASSVKGTYRRTKDYLQLVTETKKSVMTGESKYGEIILADIDHIIEAYRANNEKSQ